jgi:hypothetical protein
MDKLSIQDLKEKIKKVEQDLINESGRKYEVLMEYKSYLEDELRMLQRASTS